MKKPVSGFTLVELVVVIVILGILAAIALPKFIDLSADANQATLKGLVAAFSSANALNYNARKVNPAKGVPVATCGDILNAVQTPLPAGYSLGSAGTTISPNVTSNCSINGPNGLSAQYSATGIN